MKSPTKIKAYFMSVDPDSMMPLQGKLRFLDNTLEAKQKYVGGLIQCVSLTPEIDIICNDEGKLLELPANRAWIDIDEDGNIEVIDLLVGNILCVRHNGEDFTSIHDEDVEVIRKHLVPVIQTNAGLMPIPESLMEVDDYDED